MQVRRLNARIQTPVGRGDDRESLATVGGWTMPPDVNTGIEALAAFYFGTRAAQNPAGGEPANAATAAPAVTGVSPTSGPVAGGDTVTVTGTGFTGTTGVSFGTVAATNLAVASDTQLTVTSPPAAAAGTVDVTVTTPAGTSAITPADQFTYS